MFLPWSKAPIIKKAKVHFMISPTYYFIGCPYRSSTSVPMRVIANLLNACFIVKGCSRYKTVYVIESDC